MKNILKALPKHARAHYWAAVLAAFAASLIIIVAARWSENPSPSSVALVAVCGLMITLGSATQCIRIMLLDQKQKDTESAPEQ